MSNGYRWEILPNVVDGGMFLNYWDINGDDVNIEIAPDGTAELVDYIHPIRDPMAERDEMGLTEVRSTINLSEYLLEWLQIMTQEAGDEEQDEVE